MKPIFLSFLFALATLISWSQNEYTLPQENLRPDSISTFFFLNQSLKVENFPHARPTSNYGFRTRSFKIFWSFISTTDINTFVSRSMQSFSKDAVVDTLNCVIFGEGRQVFLVKKNRKNQMLIFPTQSGAREFFLVEVYNKKKIRSTVEYIEKNFTLL